MIAAASTDRKEGSVAVIWHLSLASDSISVMQIAFTELLLTGLSMFCFQTNFFICFSFSSLTLHFRLDDFYCPIFKDCFPCHVKCASPSENNSSSLTVSTYSCHLHFTYESIFFCFYDKIHIYWHTLFIFSTRARIILLPESCQCPCQN